MTALHFESEPNLTQYMIACPPHATDAGHAPFAINSPSTRRTAQAAQRWFWAVLAGIYSSGSAAGPPRLVPIGR